MTLAAIDRGAGVVLVNTFLIHTRAAELRSATVIHAATLADQLALLRVLAANIGEAIPFYQEEQAIQLGAQGAACPASPTDVPWFFLNAAICESHGIAGQGDALRTLILILQRPWCVLELACVRKAAVLLSLLQFAQTCAALPGMSKQYRAAVELLSSEIRVRAATSPTARSEGCRGSNGIRDTRRQLEGLSAATFTASLASWNGIWLRAVCSWSALDQAPVADIGRQLEGIISSDQTGQAERSLSGLTVHTGESSRRASASTGRYSRGELLPIDLRRQPFAAATARELLHLYVAQVFELIS